LIDLKFGLGTASWGSTNPEKIDSLLEFSLTKDFSAIDLSPYYSGGRPLDVLGKSRFRTSFSFILKIGLPYVSSRRSQRLVAKVQKKDSEYIKPFEIRAEVTKLLRRLRLSEVSVVLLHSPPIKILEESDDYSLALTQLKSQGLCQDIGFSSDALDTILPTWAKSIESSIDSRPVNHVEKINHVFFGVSRKMTLVKDLIAMWPCAERCTFTLLSGTTDSNKIALFRDSINI
jgi:aryl-alcohol dehydrogenase-like predicted oxidoreductase